MNADHQPSRLRPRWRKVFSDLWGDKTRTSLVVASIAVGVFAIGMIITTYVILAEDINRSYAAVNPPNVVVWTDPFDKDFVKAIDRLPGITGVEGRRLVPIRARKGADNWQALTLVGLAEVPGLINRLVPFEGVGVPRDDEILISQDLLHVTGFHPGDRIEIELPGSSNRTLTVVGLVTDQTASLPDISSTNNAFVTLKTLDGYGLGTQFNQLYVTVAGGTQPAPIARAAAQIKDQVKDSQRPVYRLEEKLSNEHPMTSLVLAVMGLLGALGGLITLLSSALIVNTLNALLAQQLRQIGIMKLVGARSLQILGMYLALILAYSLIALVLAVPLGVLAGYAMAWTIATLLGAVLQGFRIVPVAIVAQVLLATLVPLGASFFPINSGAKTKVQQAISSYRPGDQTAKRKWFHLDVERTGWIYRPLLLSFRNTFRKRGRLLMTLFTLTVAGAVFIAVFNVRDSMSHVISQVMDHFLGDMTVDFTQPYRVDQVQHDLLGMTGVTGVEGWGGTAGEIWNANDQVLTNLDIVAPPQSTQLLHPDFVAGRWLLPHEPNALVVSDSIYKFYPNLQPGDQLVVKIPGRKKEAWQVVGIFRFVSMLGDPIAYADFDVLAEKMYLPKQALSYRLITQWHDAAALDGLTQRLNTFLKDRHYPVQSVRSGYSLRTNSTQAVDVLILFLLIMAVLTAFVGSIGLTGTMSINVLERTREIGVMRTIGAVDGVVMLSVIIEALVIGLLTWLMAIGLSFPISFLLLNIIGDAIMGSALALTFTPLGILLWLAGVLLLSVIASIVPARNAARLTINEVLAYE